MGAERHEFRLLHVENKFIVVKPHRIGYRTVGLYIKGEQYRAKDATLRYATKDRHWTG